jgi:hypothetical protein
MEKKKRLQYVTGSELAFVGKQKPRIHGTVSRGPQFTNAVMHTKALWYQLINELVIISGGQADPKKIRRDGSAL